ncbi:MAG: hypothetical protein ABIQ31_07200 [Ferruginibacter sp.]
MQLLLHASSISPRLQYICDFIFKEIMLADVRITTNQEQFDSSTGIKIKYANESNVADHFTIGNHGLLFETNIREQKIQCFELTDFKAFFKTETGDYPFDIFSASFYLLSRYEEYLPHKKDSYGRYAHENSLAFKENFLHLPIINIWVNHFIKMLQEKYPGMQVSLPPCTFFPTYDIDMAFSYKHKGWLRNIGGFFKSPSLGRIRVLLGLKKDFFDSYEWLDELHSRHNLQPLYFFLIAAKNSRYDKNVLPGKKAMRHLVQQHANKYPAGIHPSWQSGDQPGLLKKEKELLETISEQPVTKSRQHYIRFNLPEGYRQLPGHGITDDYSMGYGSINGFRASVASSFNWFDLQKNEPALLRVHPFCYMDANSFYEQKYSAEEAFSELLQYYAICKKVKGQMISIWHNNFLGTDPQFKGWREIYEQFIIEVQHPCF